jgi:long-chain acyl-CoA synthetase
MLELATVNDIFSIVASGKRSRVMLWLDASGVWQPISSPQIYQRCRAVASQLADWGLKKGDRVAILAENRWEWAVADFAILALGAVDVPIYPTLTAQQIATLLSDSGARAIFVSSRTQYDKVSAIKDQTHVERVVIMDEENTPDAVLFSSIVRDADTHGSKRDADFDAAASAVQPDDLATLIYTSGTTGEPKGVMLTHGNIASNVNYSTAEFGFLDTDTCISFLPLSHITARHLDYAILAQKAAIAYCPQFDKLPLAMTTVRPTIFVSVPRVYEKIRQEVERRAALSAIKSRMLNLALKLGRRHRETVLHGDVPASPLWHLARRLIYGKIQAAFGGRVRYYISGGAPLGLDTAYWFADIGVRILEGYGLTETSPVLAINSPVAARVGSVGKPLPNVECCIAADGELLVRGPNVFKGYWQKMEETQACFDEAGWFATGDIARIDDDGFLYVTDRKKELLKTSGGKLIAPQPIENRLKANFMVAHAALVGDRHKFASVLIAPNFIALQEWALEQGIVLTSRRELVEHPTVSELYKGIIDDVNAGLANFETVKRFRIVAEEWSLDTGELTPSLKLKRRVITERYAVHIAEFYVDEATSRA